MMWRWVVGNKLRKSGSTAVLVVTATHDKIVTTLNVDGEEVVIDTMKTHLIPVKLCPEG